MRELWPSLKAWLDSSEPFALATVVKAGRPGPRGIGAVMAISGKKQKFIGSVSAGCVESVVMEEASKACETGQTIWQKFSGQSGFPWEIELTCGGKITVRIDPIPTNKLFRSTLAEMLHGEEPGLLVLLNGKGTLFRQNTPPVGDNVDTCLLSRVHQILQTESALEEWDTSEGATLAYRIDPPRRLFIIGAAHTSLHLIPMAKALLYRTILVDPRDPYLDPDRFPDKPNQIFNCWPAEALQYFNPGPHDAAVVLSHDAKIDDDALLPLLQSDIGYVGALGSQRSHQARLKRLHAAGATEEQTSRIWAPIGMAIESRTPAQIATSIAAQLVQVHINRKEARSAK